jgi:DNA adenine methylase
MKPFIPYIGSKRRLASYISDLLPPHTTYVEPFFGGGAVFFSKSKSTREVINDIDPRLIHLYKTLQSLSTSMIPDGSITDRSVLYALAINEAHTDIDKAIQYIVQISNGYCSGWIAKNHLIYHSYCPLKRLRKFKPYKDRLTDTIIHNEDFKTIISRYDAEDTIFFLDPPYEVLSKELYSLKEPFNHTLLRDILSHIKGKFILTLNDSPHVRELYKDYCLLEVFDGHINGTKFGKEFRKELLVKNF